MAQATKLAFEEDYRDPNNVIRSFLAHIDGCRKKWGKCDGASNSGEIYAPYFALVQGSMMGKTRMSFMLPRNGVFTFYICLRYFHSTGFPYRIPKLAAALTSDACTEGFYAAFLVSALEKLSEFRLSNPEGSASEWFQLQQNDGAAFWDPILANAQSKAYLEPFLFSKTPNSAEQASLVAYQRKLGKEFSRLLWEPEASGSLSNLAKDNIVFIFDEARSLFGPVMDPGQDSNYLLLTRALAHFPRNAGFHCPVGIMTDTTFKLSNLLPRLVPMSMRLYPPFYLLANVDIWLQSNDAPKTHANLTDWKCYCRYGRPHWGALVRQAEHVNVYVDDIMDLARVKVLCRQEGPRSQPFTSNEALAILGIRTCIDVVPQSHVSHDLVAYHMRTLLHISDNRDLVLTGYFSEPVLVQAAAQLSNWPNFRWKELLEELGRSLKNGVVSAGVRGELVARVLLLLAWDRCCLGSISIGGEEGVLSSGVFLRPIPLIRFVDALVNLPAETMGELQSQFDNCERTAWVRCSHFVRLGHVPGVDQLLELYRRGAVAILTDLPVEPGVDLVIPIVFCKDETAELKVDMVSCVLVQITNSQTLDKFYPVTATAFPTLEAADISLHPDLPYLSLYMSLGPFEGPSNCFVARPQRSNGRNKFALSLSRKNAKGAPHAPANKSTQECLAVFTISGNAYKNIQCVAGILEVIRTASMDPVSVHSNDEQAQRMVKSMLPLQFHSLS